MGIVPINNLPLHPTLLGGERKFIGQQNGHLYLHTRDVDKLSFDFDGINFFGRKPGKQSIKWFDENGGKQFPPHKRSIYEKIKSFTVEEDLYSAAAYIAKNELKMSVSQLIEHLLSGFVDGHYKVEKKQTLQTVNRPISLTRKQLIYILTTVFSDKGYVLKPHTRDGKCYYEISKDGILLSVCILIMRNMRHTSCVYQIGADLTAPLLNYVQEKNILFQMLV
ncbi:MAG: hypothetical protein ACLTER_18035 [Ruminococcus sp.]